MSEGNNAKRRKVKKPIIVFNDAEEQNHEPVDELEDFSAMDLREIDRCKIAFRGTNDGLWDWDLRTNEVYFSPSWKSMLGFMEDEIGSSKDEWFSRIHPEDIERIKEGIDISLDELNGHYEDVYRMLHEDGTYRWVLCRGIVLRDADGKPYRMVGSNTDISERMWTEERLKQVASELEKKNVQIAFSNQRLEAVLNSTGDAIAMFSVGKQLLALESFRYCFFFVHYLTHNLPSCVFWLLISPGSSWLFIVKHLLQLHFGLVELPLFPKCSNCRLSQVRNVGC